MLRLSLYDTLKVLNFTLNHLKYNFVEVISLIIYALASVLIVAIRFHPT